MKFKLKDWAAKKLGKGHRKRSGPPEETFEGIPLLPATRPSTLTPSPSKECLVPAQECLFFRRLPAELRREILVQAFGDRRVHMDLSFVHPVDMASDRRTGTWRDVPHAGLPAYLGTVNWDTSVPKSWQWWSSVCHRGPPKHLQTFADRHRQVDAGPAMDLCRFGGPHSCPDWPGEYPLKCKIGAMGWLLACRQASVHPLAAADKLGSMLTRVLQLCGGYSGPLQDKYDIHVWWTALVT